MWTVTKVIEFCAGHRLLNYSGACSNLHGHNFRVEIHISKRVLNDSGLTIDFKEIKNRVGVWIDEFWDHGFIISEYDDVLMKFFSENREFKKFILNLPYMRFVHDKVDILLQKDQEIALCNPTVENLSYVLRNIATELLNFPVEVTLYESSSGWVTTS